MQSIKIKCPACDTINTSESLYINKVETKEIRSTSGFVCKTCGTEYSVFVRLNWRNEAQKGQMIDKVGENEC